jgi:type II secretory pathway component GspD/PulD (secretin)
MKHYFSIFANHRIALIILLFHATLYLFLPISSTVAKETDAGEELISLTVKDEPLGDVLYKVSMDTGYDISLDDKWQNYRITASFKEISLHKGLKRILKDLNSAIIYVSNKKIKIIIYGKTASEGASYTPSDEEPLDKTPVSQHPSYRPLRQQRPLPTSQDIKKEDDYETDEESADNTVVSDQGSETGTPSNEEEEKIIPESVQPDSTGGIDKDLEDKSSEGDSEQDSQSESKYE